MNNIKIKLKTSELTGAALDWAVARCEVGDAINRGLTTRTFTQLTGR
jgi:hypothetical protein